MLVAPRRYAPRRRLACGRRGRHSAMIRRIRSGSPGATAPTSPPLLRLGRGSVAAAPPIQRFSAALCAASPFLCGSAALLVSRACVPCLCPWSRFFVPPSLGALRLAATSVGARAAGGSRPRDVSFSPLRLLFAWGLFLSLAPHCSRCLRSAAACAARDFRAAPWRSVPSRSLVRSSVPSGAPRFRSSPPALRGFPSVRLPSVFPLRFGRAVALTRFPFLCGFAASLVSRTCVPGVPPGSQACAWSLSKGYRLQPWAKDIGAPRRCPGCHQAAASWL